MTVEEVADGRVFRLGLWLVISLTLVLLAMAAYIVVDLRRGDWMTRCTAAGGDHYGCAARVPTFG